MTDWTRSKHRNWTLPRLGRYHQEKRNRGDHGQEETKKVEPRYAVNIAMKAWDIAKAGAAVKLKVRDRDGLLGTIEIGQSTFGWKSARTSISTHSVACACRRA